MTFKAFYYGCWFSHSETIWQSNVLTCLQCGTVIQVLPQATVRGPAHHPEPVRGTPKVRAVVAEQVKPFQRKRA